MGLLLLEVRGVIAAGSLLINGGCVALAAVGWVVMRMALVCGRDGDGDGYSARFLGCDVRRL